MAAVQKLYEACKLSFPSAIPAAPSPAAVKSICKVLDGIHSSDVGLDEEPIEQERGFGFFGSSGRKGRHSSMTARWSPPISYLHLHECPSFSMGIFCLPTSAAIPLHNHPGMTVFSRLLHGTLHVRSYDWVDKQNEVDGDPRKPKLAKLVMDQVMSGPCQSIVLFPTTGGNIHAFTAITSCAILDVLVPPYSPSSGRHCTYFQSLPYSTSSTTDDCQYAYLEEYEPPDDFVVRTGTYNGPRVKP